MLRDTIGIFERCWLSSTLTVVSMVVSISVYLVFFCVTLAINKSFYFHPVGVSSFFVRMASNLFSCLSVPNSLLPRECSCLGHACCRRFRDVIICLCVIVGLSFLLLPHFFSEYNLFREIGPIIRSGRFIALFTCANEFTTHRGL